MIAAQIAKGARWLGTVAGTFVATWMLAHGAKAADAAAMSAAIGGVIVALGSYGWSVADAYLVKGKITAATATGASTVAENPQAIPQIAAASGSPKALASLVAQLQAGKA